MWSPQASVPIFFDFPGGTVRQLLDSFVSQFPAYQWREDKGIIHVFWHGTHLPLADVAISYPGAQGKTLGQMRLDIPDIPEIKAWLDSHHCSHDRPLRQMLALSFMQNLQPIPILRA